MAKMKCQHYLVLFAVMGLLAACGDTEPERPSVTAMAEAVGKQEIEGGGPSPAAITAIDIYDDFFGAAVASLEERIYVADVIVRATLVSAEDGLLRFNAVEYLKVTGAKKLAVRVSTSGRNTQWDDQEAVLFLTLSTDQSQPRSSGSSTAAFEFADTTASIRNMVRNGEIPYTGNLPKGYVIGSRNPVWLPAEEASSPAGARSSSDPSFITADGSPFPTVSLSDLRSKIAWIEGGDGIEGYDQCIRGGLSYDRYYRDWEAYHGEPSPLAQSEKKIASGAGGGGTISDYGPRGTADIDAKYDRFWLSGRDAALFSSQIVDDDTAASNGYHYTVTTARPLPGGTYRVINHIQGWRSMRCNHIPQHNRLEFVVTVTAPSGVLHEAFFDPVTDGTAVAADSSNGQLEPAAFTDGNGAAATIQRIEWVSATVKVTVSPHLGLTGHKLDFIELDGSVSLSLQVDDATVDAANNTLSWTVAEQPWEDGDLLMLRIAELVTEVDLVNVPASITQGQTASVTVRATDLSSSNSYTVRLAANSFAIGFNNSCLYGSKTVVVPSGSASHSATIPLQGCDATSSTVTATLMQGTSTVATATAKVEVEASSNVTVTLSPREERHGTYTNMTAQWNDPSGCVGRYYVGIFNSQQTVVNNLGYHPAPATTSLSADPSLLWDDIPNLDWFVRVRCHPSDNSGLTIVGQASLQSGLPSTP